MRVLSLFLLGSSVAAIAIAACGGDDGDVGNTTPDAGPTADGGPRGVEFAGQACTAPTQCYGNVDGGADSGLIKGTVTCLTKIPNGYCTHVCNDDSDCCAAPGECRTGVKQVCSPLENQPEKYCFLSCEQADINTAIAANADAGYYDGGNPDAGSVDTQYCKSYAAPSTECRSSGGGNKNRKVCIPKE